MTNDFRYDVFEDSPDDPFAGRRDNGGGGAPRFVLTRFAKFNPIDGEDYCVKGVLPRSGLVVFWGPPKCGKSFFVFRARRRHTRRPFGANWALDFEGG